MPERELFLDLDGVLADFNAHVEALFGVPPDAMPLSEMWRRAASTPRFFEIMPMTPDAPELWAFSQQFGPTILTGLPRGTWAEGQKRRWVAGHLGADVLVITCMARDKCLFASEGAVLVDDTTKFAHLWEAKGGLFVHHTSAEASIAELRHLGFGRNAG